MMTDKENCQCGVGKWAGSRKSLFTSEEGQGLISAPPQSRRVSEILLLESRNSSEVKQKIIWSEVDKEESPVKSF